MTALPGAFALGLVKFSRHVKSVFDSLWTMKKSSFFDDILISLITGMLEQITPRPELSPSITFK